MNLKTKVRHLCLDKGVSIARVEKDLGFGQNTIGHWDKSLPKVDKFFAVCKYFEVDPEEVLKEIFTD